MRLMTRRMLGIWALIAVLSAASAVKADFAPRTIDLMPLIDVSKDAVNGKWTLQDGTLLSDRSSNARLRIPYEPPEEYDFHIEFVRTSGNDAVGQMFLYFNHCCMWEMGAISNTLCGFNQVNKASPADDGNPTTFKGNNIFENGRQYSSLVQVRRNSVIASIDGKVICTCTLSQGHYSIPQKWSVGTKCLGVGSWGSSVTFKDINVTEISGPGTIVKTDPDPGEKKPERETADSEIHPDEQQDSTPLAGTTIRVAKPVSSIQSLEVYTTDTGLMLGQTSQVSLTVNRGNDSKLTAIRFVTPVGDQMRLARDEALRFIRLTYPNWYADNAEISFEDKYNGHEGGSIGAALGTLILSAIQGFDIDPNLAMTGDISANGRVRMIGGVYAKLRGAVASHCTIVAMPADNYDQIVDTAIYSGWDVASKVQIIGISSLDDAVAVARTDRAANLAAAISDFAAIQQSLEQSPEYLHTQDAQDRLAEVLRLAPQHLSAKLLLMFAQGKQPKTLSATASEYYTFVAVNTMMPLLKERFEAGASGTLTPSVVKDGLADLKKLRPMADESIRPLIDAWSLYIWSISRFEAGDVTADAVEAKRQALLDVMTRLGTDQDLMQKQLKEGM